jgi:hypothetical protein
MARFDPGASFAVVAQKDGSYAVEVHEPRRVVPLRITGYASEAEATAAIVTFTATMPLERPHDPVAPAKLTGDIAAGHVADAVEDKRDPAAMALGQRGGKARASVRAKKGQSKIARKASAKRSKR